MCYSGEHTMFRIATVVVTWNSIHTIENCLESLMEQNVLGFMDNCLIVVDNASSDGTPEAAAKYEEVEVVRLATNHGFTGAVNMIWQRHKYDALCVVNPDVALEADCLVKLTVAMLQRDAWAVGPVLFRVNSLDDKSNRVVDTAGLIITTPLRVTESTKPPAEDVIVDGISGACILVRVDDSPYLFDPAYFAYKEDIDFALRCKGAGKEMWVVSQARGYHIRRWRSAGSRRYMSRDARLHSLKNDFLLYRDYARQVDVCDKMSLCAKLLAIVVIEPVTATALVRWWYSDGRRGKP